MKQCDRDLSPFPSQFAIASSSSSSLSFAASESDPADSFWRDFTFDFSFLSSDDHKIGLDDDVDSTTVPKAEESELYGLAANAGSMKVDDLGIRKGENSDSFLKLPNFLESDLSCVDSKPLPSLAVVSTSRFDSNVTVVDGVTNDSSGSNVADTGACSAKVMVSKDINGSNSSPLFTKISTSSINCDQDEAEVDSPCWRGTRSHDTAASGTKSLTFRRCSDDLNVLYGLNPLAPQFIPSSAKNKLDKNAEEFKDDGSSSLKRSLSSTFPPSSSGEFSTSDPSEAGIEQDSSQMNRTGILIHDADESLGLVFGDSVSRTMSILDTSNQFQTPKKLDPLAPVFVPANAKLSSVVYEQHGVTDHMIAIETNALSSYAVSSSDDMLLKVETHSSEVGHSFRSPYCDNNVHESGKTYSFNPRLGSQVQISENTKLGSSCNKTHGLKKLNPLAPQFSLANTKPKVYSSKKNQAASDLLPKGNSSVLFSPIGLAQSSLHVEPSFNEVDTKQMGPHRPNISLGNSSPQMDVKKLLTTIHGLSELLTHVHGTETSDSPNEQDLDLINCTVQNLNSYINNRVQEHTGNYPSAVHSSWDLNSLPKVVENHQTEEQINPQVFFYRSLWLKAKADRSLMEYETFLSKMSN